MKQERNDKTRLEGHWIYHACIREDLLECSECGHLVEAYSIANYCPKCGAKMSKKQT